MAGQTDTLHALGGVIVDSALKVHKELGPGLPESVYEHCLAYELEKRCVAHKRQFAVPIHYDSKTLDGGLRIDLLVEDSIVVEIKSVEKLAPIHEAQLLTYLKLASKPMGFLINFNVRLLKDGVRRYVK